MRLFLSGAVTLVSAGMSFGAVFQSRDLGSGPDVAHVVVEFTTGDAVQFNYAFTPDAGSPLTGFNLLGDIAAATVGTAEPFSFTSTHYSFGDAIDTMTYGTLTDGTGYVPPDGYWHYWTKPTADSTWGYSDVGVSDRTVSNGTFDGWTFSDASPVPEPAGLAVIGLLGAWCLRRRRSLALAAAGVVTLTGATVSNAADSVTVVAGSYTQGTVKSSLATPSYQNTATNLHDFPLNTGSSSTTAYPIALSNNNYAASTLLAFGNGGGVTLQFDAPIHPLSNAKEFGIFTAQFVGSGGVLFNGNMQASVLVSADGANWRTLDGATVSNPLNYTANSYELNAPSSAYVYASGNQSYTYGLGTTPANLSALSLADYQTPMPNDSIFNDPSLGTNAARDALNNDTTGSLYSGIYGTSGGGNWFDISGAGLASVQYVRLNGVNTDPNGGIRLDSVFANAAAVPEPSICVGLAAAVVFLKRRRF